MQAMILKPCMLGMPGTLVDLAAVPAETLDKLVRKAAIKLPVEAMVAGVEADAKDLVGKVDPTTRVAIDKLLRKLGGELQERDKQVKELHDQLLDLKDSHKVLTLQRDETLKELEVKGAEVEAFKVELAKVTKERDEWQEMAETVKKKK